MGSLLEGIAVEELSGENYIVKFPIEFLDNGYSSCDDIAKKLNMSFPKKNFCWLPNYLTFEEYSISMLEKVIEELKNILKDKKTEQEDTGDTNE